MKVGDRYVNGVIKEKQEAEEIYQRAKDSGKKTSLISSSQTNIFKTKLANIEPGEMIVVEIRYQDKLSLINGEYNIRIPTVITHRYVKGSNTIAKSDEAKFIPYDNDIHSPINDSKEFTVNPYNINIDLNVGFKILSPESKDDLNVLILKTVSGVIKLKDKSIIYINSDFAKYNAITFDTFFYQNVSGLFEENKIFSNNLDLFFKDNKAIMYNDILFFSKDTKANADEISFNLLNGDIKLKMFDEKKIKVVKN